MLKTAHLFEEPAASELDKKRETARSKWCITYDCFNAVVRDDRVVCIKGYSLAGKVRKSMTLLSVLAGRSAQVCKECVDWEE